MEIRTQFQDTKNYRCNKSANFPTQCPGAQCKVYYIQPPRGQSFAPKRTFCPPSVEFQAQTTYHNSYENFSGDRYKKLIATRPSENLHLINEPFDGKTTFGMSYQPVWNAVKRKPIIPQTRKNAFKGSMQKMTTVRQDYCKKLAEKRQLIMPCGSISVSSKPFDFRTTAALSYNRPGIVEPIKNFKPVREYHFPVEKLSDVTTSKLSYQPLQIPQKEKYKWAQRPQYERSNIAMDIATTYSQSFYKNNNSSPLTKVKPIIPVSSRHLFNYSDENSVPNTLYKELFIPHQYERINPIIPCNSISSSNERVSCDTTSKLSYQAVNGEKRAPILPKKSSLFASRDIISFHTTNRENFGPKNVEKAVVSIPSDNIHNSTVPFEAVTTSQFSYVHPGISKPLKSFKPHVQYDLPTIKLDTETVNKLSYKLWNFEPKAFLPWAQKRQYKPPHNPMAGESTYCSSFSPPGYFIEECPTANKKMDISSCCAPCDNALTEMK